MIKFKVKQYLWSTDAYHFNLEVVLVSVGRLKLFAGGEDKILIKRLKT